MKFETEQIENGWLLKWIDRDEGLFKEPYSGYKPRFFRSLNELFLYIQDLSEKSNES